MADINLRRAAEKDVDILFQWVNHPSSIAAKLKTPEPIPYGVHKRWLAAKAVDPNARLWIAEKSGRDIGQVRVEKTVVGLEVDIFVSPDCRGSGYGQQMLLALEQECDKVWPRQPLIARILPGNKASIALFLNSGYEMVEVKDNHHILRRDVA